MNDASDRPLIAAVIGGDARRAHGLLASGHDVNESTPEGWTALMYAAQRAGGELVRALLAAGADPDRRNRYDASALTVARDTPTLAVLLESRATVETRMHALRRHALGVSPVFAVQVARSLPEPERSLAERGIALIDAARRPPPHDELRALLRAPEARAVVERFGGLALICGRWRDAAARGDLDLPRRLLELGADPNTLEQGASPLRTAVEAREPGLVRLLLDSGADPGLADADGVTPLMILMGYQDWHDDRARPARGFDRTVDEIARRLLDAGADVDARIRPRASGELAGCTPLMLGLAMRPRNVKRLLDAGADPALADARGFTPLHACREPATAERLRAGGADVNARTARGETPLHGAIEAGCLPMVKWLWRFREARDARTADGRAPLALARSRGRTEIAAWLAERAPAGTLEPAATPPPPRPAPEPASIPVPASTERLVVRVVTDAAGVFGAEGFAPVLAAVAALGLPPPATVMPPGLRPRPISTWQDPAVLMALDGIIGVTDVRDAEGRVRLLLGQAPRHSTLWLETDEALAVTIPPAAWRTFLEKAVVELRAVYGQCHFDVRSRELHRAHYDSARRTFYADGLFWLTFFGGDELERQGGDAVVLNPFAACTRVGAGVLLQVGESPRSAVSPQGEEALVRATRALPPVKAVAPAIPGPPGRPEPLRPETVAGVRGTRDPADGSFWIAKHVAASTRLDAATIARLAQVVGAGEPPIVRVQVLFSRRAAAERNSAALRAARIGVWYIDPITGTRRVVAGGRFRN